MNIPDDGLKIKEPLDSRGDFDYVLRKRPLPRFPVTRARITYLVFLSGSSLWCAAILVAPLLSTAGGDAGRLGAMLYEFFRPVCHQIDQRSFHLLQAPLAVCMRCSAIYFAFFTGVLFYPVLCSIDRPVVPDRKWLLIAALPMLLDVAAGLLGVHESSLFTRTVTGGLAGLVLPFYCLPVALDAVGGRSRVHSFLPPSVRKDA